MKDDTQENGFQRYPICVSCGAVIIPTFGEKVRLIPERNLPVCNKICEELFETELLTNND